MKTPQQAIISILEGDVVDDLFSPDARESDIAQLKEEIARLIEDALAHDASKQGFTFYIDDLDRIDPPVAVEILELLKNIFDLERCVFILAIDYDVVIKGLKPKFGELTESNEREFRSFFDKIIQLPFSMPVASYNVDTFLVDALRKIEFFTDEELDNPQLAEDLSEIARLSVGSNPRSLKRLTNTLALISLINEAQASQDARSQPLLAGKELNFALVCMQIAYPYIYNQLTEEPDFKNWNDRIASRLKLRPLTEVEKASLDSVEEFDEEWEKVLFRMCQKETYLSTRTFSVSGLLNKIAGLVGNDAELGSAIAATLELSAVTNLKAFDGDPLTYNNYMDWVGIDLGQARTLQEVRLLPRTDDNGIAVGHLYKLFYFGRNGWVEAATQRATGQELTFADVPGGALYWLQDVTRGREERIFTYEDGRVVFH